MATVLPFCGLRPPAELAAKVAAPPYDVVSTGEARELAAANPTSFLHINKPEIDLSPDTDVHSQAVYDRGRLNLDNFISSDILVQDNAPMFYLYRQSLGEHSQTGLVALVSADEYENGIIKKHELTRPAKENDRVEHMRALAAQTGPVFLTYQADQALKTLQAECTKVLPTNDFMAEGVRHQLWVIPDQQYLQKIIHAFSHIPSLFVADGHHRSAAAVRYRALCRDANPSHSGDEPYNYFMAVLFPHDELNILGYHRVVRDLGGYDEAGFLKALQEDFDTEPVEGDPIPRGPGEFGLYMGGSWTRLVARNVANSSEIVESLDVSVLQKTVFSPLLDIQDVRTDPRVDFIGGIRGRSGLETAVDSGSFRAAFACYPVRIQQLMAIAEAGKLMPPKSTWFEPKLKSGLVVHAMD